MGIADADWISTADPMLVMWYGSHDMAPLEAPPTVAATNIPLSETHARRRCNTLASGGLLAKAESKNGYYYITDAGKRWISGEMDRDELAELDPREPAEQ